MQKQKFVLGKYLPHKGKVEEMKEIENYSESSSNATVIVDPLSIESEEKDPFSMKIDQCIPSNVGQNIVLIEPNLLSPDEFVPKSPSYGELVPKLLSHGEFVPKLDSPKYIKLKFGENVAKYMENKMYSICYTTILSKSYTKNGYHFKLLTT